MERQDRGFGWICGRRFGWNQLQSDRGKYRARDRRAGQLSSEQKKCILLSLTMEILKFLYFT